MKKISFTILNKKLKTLRKAASRKAQIDAGIKTPSNKVHKSKKDYTRKVKHKAISNE